MRTLLLCLFLSSTVASAGELRLSPHFQNADLFRRQYATLFSGLSRVLVNDVPLEQGFCTSFDDACRSKVWNYARMVDLRLQLETFLMLNQREFLVFADDAAILRRDSDAMFHAYRTLERWMSVLSLPPFNLERNRLRLADYIQFIYFADKRLPTHVQSEYQSTAVTRFRSDSDRRFYSRDIESIVMGSEMEELFAWDEESFDLVRRSLEQNPVRRLAPVVMVPDHLNRIQIREILEVLLDFATVKDEYDAVLGCHALSTRECAEISEDFAPHLQQLFSVGERYVMFSGRRRALDPRRHSWIPIGIPVQELRTQDRDSRSQALGNLALDVVYEVMQRRSDYE